MKQILSLISIWAIVSVMSSSVSWAQKKDIDLDLINVANLEVIDGDTIPAFELDVIPVVSYKIRTKDQQRKYRKLKRNLIKVYPYAQRAITLLHEVELATSQMHKKRHKKKFIRGKEKELKKQFKKELKKLTVSQGKVLIKLIERDTGQPFFKTLKSMKNPVSAFFWHNISKTFGYNLKEGYDPKKHADLEELVSFLEENGLRALAYRSRSRR